MAKILEPLKIYTQNIVNSSAMKQPFPLDSLMSDLWDDCTDHDISFIKKSRLLLNKKNFLLFDDCSDDTEVKKR